LTQFSCFPETKNIASIYTHIYIVSEKNILSADFNNFFSKHTREKLQTRI